MLQNFEENTLRLNALVSDDPPAKALAKIYKSIQRNPRSASAWVRYSFVAVGLGKRDLAERGLEFALASRRVTSSVLFDIGHTYEQIDRLESAEKCFKRVAELNTRAINPRIRQALLLERGHQFGRARDVLDECMHLDANDHQVQYLMALLDSREGKLDSAEIRLRQILSSGPRHEYVQYASRYLLADVLDQTERFDEAMRHLSEAKQLVAQLADTNALAQQYNSEAAGCAFQAKGYPRNILQIWDKYYPKDSLAPIPPFTFLGGHPRSGTTLLEQILGAHPDVAGFDEPVVLPHVLDAANSLARQFFCNFPVNFMRRLYIKMFQSHSNQNVANKHLLEKNPSPTVMLPLLLRIFPESRIKIVWLEEYVKDQTKVFKDVCRFLEIDDSLSPNLDVENANGRDNAPARMARLGRQNVEIDTAWEPGTRQWVIDQLRDDNCRFLSHFGRKLDYWGNLY